MFKKMGEAYVAHNATVLRDVSLGKDVSVWFNVVLRGDDAPISVGAGTNIQDFCMVHADPGVPLTIGEDVTIGHGAIIHCKSIGDRSLIGMGSVLLDNVEIGDECLIAAGAVVSPNTIVPSRSLVVGVPGKVKRQLTDEEIQGHRRSALKYTECAKSYLA